MELPPADVARVLGDTVRTLLRTYTHAMPADNEGRLRFDLDAMLQLG